MLKILPVLESSKRGVRTLLQGIMTAAGLLALFAIPAVGDALNSVLQLINPGWSVAPGVVAAVGLLCAAVTALISKLQNVLEGRDKATTPEEYAAQAEDLTDLVKELRAALVETYDAMQGRHIA